MNAMNRSLLLHVLLLLVAAIALGGIMGCAPDQPAADTPRTAFEDMRAAALARDFGAVFDRCDEKGQSLLLEVAFGLFTMELWERYHFTSKDTAAIQQAFAEDLGLDAKALETADRDAASRRRVLLLMLATSKGPMRDTMGEMLQSFSRLELTTIEMLDENTARATFVADNTPRSGYMTRRDGRWLLVSGLSFPGGRPPTAN
jgi:hypothetical protein